MIGAYKWLLVFFCLPTLIHAQDNKHTGEWSKISYNIETNVVASMGEHTPFWFVSNRHGQSSIENKNANINIGIYRDFDHKKKLTWAYGIELTGAWHHTTPFYIQQLYADIKTNCWELSIGSKERWSEGKNRTLSGGGLTFSPNARPIPQVRFGINEYTTIPQYFGGWIQAKGHFSYGWQTDNLFLQKLTEDAVPLTYRTQDILLHEKTFFMRIAHPSKKGFSIEGGLEMYTQFGGLIYRKDYDGNYYLHYGLPATYKEFIKAFIPMAGGNSTPEAEQSNINGNILGSWHFIVGHTTDNWKLRAYYEHFFEDHSQMLGVSWVPDRNGDTRFLTYMPWKDGLWGLELERHQGKWIKGIVVEYITSRDQSGPILHNSNDIFKEQISGWDNYYNHYLYQSWQHWGMAICNPQFLSPIYNESSSMAMPNNRLRSYHIGIEGIPNEKWQYRMLASHTRHWGSISDPLGYPMNVISVLVETTHTPCMLQGWQIVGAIAIDHSELIGKNWGGMLTLCKIGIFN